MNEDLLPCPANCNKLIIQRIFRSGRGFSVRCSCGWEGPTAKTKEEAIIRWNSRPPQINSVPLQNYDIWMIEATAGIDRGNDEEIAAALCRISLAGLQALQNKKSAHP